MLTSFYSTTPASVPSSLLCCQGVPTLPSSRARRQRHHRARIRATPPQWTRQSQQGPMHPCVPAPALQTESSGVASTADLPITATNDLQAHDGCEDSEFAPIPVEQWFKDPVLMSGCEVHGPRLNVAVLLSGGVDSSLALRLLVAAGHRCKAFYLQIWFQEDFRNFWDSCPWEEDLQYAQKVCDALGVELEVVPLTQVYWDSVVSHSVAQIRAGRTPNPDMLCNSRVKFGAFLDILEARGSLAEGHGATQTQPLFTRANMPSGSVMSSSGSSSSRHAGPAPEAGPMRFDRVASGHYARVLRDTDTAAALHGDRSAQGVGTRETGAQAETVQHLQVPPSSNRNHGSMHNSSSSSGGVRLALSADAVKDQSYFLAQLSPRQLSRVMFPLGSLTKLQVRQLAVSAGLATQARKDSQGICFLGKVKFPEFVKEHLGEWPGLIVVDAAYDASVQHQEQQEQDRQQKCSTSPNHTGAASTPTTANSHEHLHHTHNQNGTRKHKKLVVPGAESGGKGGAANVVATYGSANVLGLHQGYWFYTVGQRGGIKLPGGPWYVTRKDPDLNIVYVSRRYMGSAAAHADGASQPGAALLPHPHTAFVTAPFNWLSDARPDQGPAAAPLYCKVRHGPHAYRCTVLPAPAMRSLPTIANSTAAAAAAAPHPAPDAQGSGQDGCSLGPQGRTARRNCGHGQLDGRGTCWYDGVPLVVVLWGTDQGLAAGQYAVLYQEGQCLGAAQMERCLAAGELKQSVAAVTAAQAADGDGGSADGDGGVPQGFDWLVPRTDGPNKAGGGTGAMVLTAEM
ncbi:tRNA methyl transferase-domain-containing protein [Dunaliella salina]|uniref:tRNA-5-taurinomethyluridine 2-sulfurtransferase n=1 Tax=Dunaliella salina TaxID=3046 RepID=A0ABQ7GSS7_DUNSA|nr:tRNA methyl transferase-domain-containing protein [Dunaliella salina]|eukprot:KAF5837650.1 tRNA methyl transferase-domain-containing protein [Dunaliella salina]